MNSVIKKGVICVRCYGIEFCLCVIEHTLFDDGSFKYVFTPNYSVISLLDSDAFQGIPGLDLDRREKEYVRKNVTPTFVSERVPSENRENLYELLDKVDLSYIDPIEYLIRTKDRYSGDDLYVVSFFEKQTININEHLEKNNIQGTIKIVLDNLAKGNNVVFARANITDDNRKDIYLILLELYLKSLKSNKEKQQRGIAAAKESHKYKGRKAIDVDPILFHDVSEKVNNKSLSMSEALIILGISRDKYYRLKKLLQN